MKTVKLLTQVNQTLGSYFSRHIESKNPRIDSHKDLFDPQSVMLDFIPSRLCLKRSLSYASFHHSEVVRGQSVRAGQVLAMDLDQELVLRAPLTGRVHLINTHEIEIEVNADAHADSNPVCFEPITAPSKEDLIKRLKEACILGLGGGLFPSHQKAMQAKSHILLVNIAECEPYLTSDQWLLSEKFSQLIEATRAIVQALGIQETVFVIESDKQAYAQDLKAALQIERHERLECLETRYPIGSEKMLIKRLFGLEIPAGQKATDVGVLCFNAATIFAIYQMLWEGKPCLSRMVSLNAQDRVPVNLWLPIGTPVHELLDLWKHFDSEVTFEDKILILSGPMMGERIWDADNSFIEWKHAGITVIEDQSIKTQSEAPCIRCGICSDACPIGLLPQALHRYARAKDVLNLENYHLVSCIECGICDYVCPSKIPLVSSFRKAKLHLKNESDKVIKGQRSKHYFEEKSNRDNKRREKMAAIRSNALSLQDKVKVKTDQNQAPSSRELLNQKQQKLTQQLETAKRRQDRKQAEFLRLELEAIQVALGQKD